MLQQGEPPVHKYLILFSHKSNILLHPIVLKICQVNLNVLKLGIHIGYLGHYISKRSNRWREAYKLRCFYKNDIFSASRKIQINMFSFLLDSLP